MARRHSHAGAVNRVAAPSHLGLEPSVHVEEQVLEAALGHQHLDPHWERMVVDPLCEGASPVHAASLDAAMFMIYSEARRSRKLSPGEIAGRGRNGPMSRQISRIFRCAICTRKVTEEGLEQGPFNSLDAQHEQTKPAVQQIAAFR